MTRGPRFLMIRRADLVAKGGYWCFPGGHVERGETPRQAIRRELAEELGVAVTPIERLGSIRVLGARRYILVVWRVRHDARPIRAAASEIAEARWVTPSEARTIHPTLPSNERVFAMLGL